MLTAVNGVDLIAKEFKKHSKCYNMYTKVLSSVLQCDKRSNNNTCDEVDVYVSVVKPFVDKTVIVEGKCIPLDILLELSKINKDAQKRKVHKRRLQRTYKDDIFVLSAEQNQGQFICSKKSMNEISKGSVSVHETVPRLKENIVKEAAMILREIITQYIQNDDNLPWPPTVTSLQKRLNNSPELLRLFLKTLISPEDSHHLVAESTSRLTDSFAQDLVYAISKGTFFTFKHTSIGLGLHSLTGQKLPFVILYRLGHSISYTCVTELETAQGELAQHCKHNETLLPIQPGSPPSFAPTVFWWDNFGRFVDDNVGVGSIYNTPGIAFQKEMEDTATIYRHIHSKDKKKIPT